MDTNEYLRNFVKSYAVYWVVALVIGAIIGQVAAGLIPPSYQGTVTANFKVDRPLVQANDTYTYDGYYALEAGIIEKDSYLQWLASPTRLQEVFSQSGLPLPAADAEALGRTIVSGERREANTVTVAIRQENKDEADKIAQALRNVSQNYPAQSAQISLSEPKTLEVTTPTSLLIVASTLALGILTMVITLIIDFFKPTK
ncbi:hypothetical protein KC644_01915 [Candidatus Berkelbacteria bacterium]|nr:hypothetical protein [Candidatus Berkelbacteria bacterium]